MYGASRMVHHHRPSSARRRARKAGTTVVLVAVLAQLLLPLAAAVHATGHRAGHDAEHTVRHGSHVAPLDGDLPPRPHEQPGRSHSHDEQCVVCQLVQQCRHQWMVAAADSSPAYVEIPWARSVTSAEPDWATPRQPGLARAPPTTVAEARVTV